VAVKQIFSPWLDPAWYATAPDGGLENGAAGWALGGGAATDEGNEPFYVRAPTDHRSLALPSGSRATTPWICVDVQHPTVRFFARNTGSATSSLAVYVIFHALDGTLSSLSLGRVARGSAWGPTPILPVVVNLLSLLGDPHVALRFAPVGTTGHWQIDDVYIDPFGKG
jgi:hypothetical protein